MVPSFSKNNPNPYKIRLQRDRGNQNTGQIAIKELTENIPPVE
jgi:hypothetical protein